MFRVPKRKREDDFDRMTRKKSFLEARAPMGWSYTHVMAMIDRYCAKQNLSDKRVPKSILLLIMQYSRDTWDAQSIDTSLYEIPFSTPWILKRKAHASNAQADSNASVSFRLPWESPYTRYDVTFQVTHPSSYTKGVFVAFEGVESTRFYLRVVPGRPFRLSIGVFWVKHSEDEATSPPRPAKPYPDWSLVHRADVYSNIWGQPARVIASGPRFRKVKIGTTLAGTEIELLQIREVVNRVELGPGSAEKQFRLEGARQCRLCAFDRCLPLGDFESIADFEAQFKGFKRSDWQQRIRSFRATRCRHQPYESLF